MLLEEELELLSDFDDDDDDVDDRDDDDEECDDVEIDDRLELLVEDRDEVDVD